MAAQQMELNTVSQEQLASILTAKLTDRLLQERQNAPFASWDDLRFRLRGLGRKKLKVLRKAGFRVNDEVAPDQEGSGDESVEENVSNADVIDLRYAARGDFEEILSPSMTSKVIAARTDGQFTSWQDLRLRVSGLGAKKVTQLKERFFIVDSTPPEPEHQQQQTTPPPAVHQQLQQLPPQLQQQEHHQQQQQQQQFWQLHHTNFV